MNLPIFVENSKLPIWLSHISPIEIHAITLGPVILCRGAISDTTRCHESIHWEQYKECLILGFIVLYVFFYLINLLKRQSGSEAYHNIPFEVEAYENESEVSYLNNRRHFAWVKNI